MTFPGLEMTILKFHDFSRFSMTVRTLSKSVVALIQHILVTHFYDAQRPAAHIPVFFELLGRTD